MTDVPTLCSRTPQNQALCAYLGIPNDRIIKKIEALKEIYDISEFEWEIPRSCPLPIPEKRASSFQKNVYLRKR